MKSIVPTLMFVVFLLTAGPTSADDIVVYGGIQHQGRVTLETGARSPFGRPVLQVFDPVNFGVFGFRYSHGRVLGSEHSLAYTPNFVESRRSAILYNSNLLVQAPLEVARPYGTVGLGGVFTVSDTAIDIGNKLAINYGGGVKVVPTGLVGIQFDIRGYTIPGVTLRGAGDSETLNILELSLGILFSF